jgi:phage baseplate assembly protein W
MLAYTALPIEATLRAALQEISYGGLKEFSVRDGVATLTFEHEANGELSSCLAQQHEATIQETLKQFSSVKRVEFIRETK